MRLSPLLYHLKSEIGKIPRHRVFSGIQPTGTLHLGNYLGAVKNWVDSLDQSISQDSNIFSIVDLHAITLPQKPDQLQDNILGMTASLLASGLDPSRCILFQQSRVPQHAELCWILGCCATLQNLLKLSQYKDKSQSLQEVPLGLFVYPVLQSADILLYKGTKIPIGEDNLQNVETCRRLCRAFNARYGDIFVVPEPVLSGNETSRVKSLRNPTKKMSKSDPDKKGCLYINDSPDDVIEKCKKAITDFEGRVTFDPIGRPGVSNLISIHSILSTKSPEEICASVAHLNTGQYKFVVADVFIEHFADIREKINYLMNHKDHLEQVLIEGSAKAEDIAEETMKQVRKAVGFRID